jgi:hypothetical protein
MNTKNPIIAVAAAAVVAAFAAGGCCHKKCCDPKGDSEVGYQDPFFPREYARVHEAATYPQAASAARADATLYDHHFHGGRLNSLGEDKLALMFDDDDQTSATVIYLDMTVEGGEFSARQEAVRSFASSEGVDADSIRFERGAKPGNRSLAAPLLKNMPKTESKSDDSNGSIGK